MRTLLEMYSLPGKTPVSRHPKREEGHSMYYMTGKKLYYGEANKILKRVREKRGKSWRFHLNLVKIQNTTGKWSKNNAWTFYILIYRQ